jgi:hypothetical protein
MSSSYKIYIIAGTHDEYLRWRNNNYPELLLNGEISKPTDITYVSGAETLKGISNPRGRFIGTWYKRSNIEEILFQLQIAGKLLDSSVMKQLLEIVEKRHHG